MELEGDGDREMLEVKAKGMKAGWRTLEKLNKKPFISGVNDQFSRVCIDVCA